LETFATNSLHSIWEKSFYKLSESGKKDIVRGRNDNNVFAFVDLTVSEESSTMTLTFAPDPISSVVVTASLVVGKVYKSAKSIWNTSSAIKKSDFEINKKVCLAV
jgi:hypothetical protein